MEKENTSGKGKKNIIALLLGVIARPRATFDYLKDNHKRAWWLPAILIVLLTAAPIFAARQQATRAESPMMMESGAFETSNAKIVVEAGGRVPGMDMPPDAGSSAALGGASLLKLAGAVLGTPAAWLIWGGALYLASVFLGRSSTFGQMFRLVVWTWLPYGIRGLVQTVYMMTTGNAIGNAGLSGFVVDQNVTSPISPGPGQLALASILGRVDLYMIWHLLLVSVGLMAFTNLKYRKALTAAVVIWVVLALLGIIPAIFGGILGGVTGGASTGIRTMG